ncbi:HET domain-containing protein [Amniculicola lignicola CBS 123094]|uniref:HET domain-containing protein n=1 Tax=Amniculicola lignicola CBS 123094 TaxID=1392246 RepID=A0A6A5W5X8_9PLEO|nr:HET domain-containing protein [Amniculicola lignicola CBS 123094]
MRRLCNCVELSEAINSMYRWYQDAYVCYVYLSDVDTEQDLDRSRWFKRGWTLQELLAPNHMVFFNREWERIDNRSNLSPTISRITGIPARVIWDTFSGNYSVAQVISWAAGRETTREEDIAYCLLGLLGVNMPLIYGEGSRAFERLQQEFMRTSTDHSLFSWVGPGIERGPFAQSPEEFLHCKDISIRESHSLDFSLTNRGLRIDLPLMRLQDGNFAAVLDVYDQDHRRRAIYLKEQRAGVYRRVRCTEELHKVGPSEMIPAPKTVYIEPAVPRILGRDRPPPQGDEHSIRIDFKAALLQGFCLEQYYSIDDLLNKWKSLDDGILVLTLIRSGQYAGLWFKNAESGDQFTVVLGVHNWKSWLDITDIGADESLESVVDEYYHFRKTCNRMCRCGPPWKNLQRMIKPLLGGLPVQVSIDSMDLEREFIVKILLESVDEGSH